VKQPCCNLDARSRTRRDLVRAIHCSAINIPSACPFYIASPSALSVCHLSVRSFVQFLTHLHTCICILRHRTKLQPTHRKPPNVPSAGNLPHTSTDLTFCSIISIPVIATASNSALLCPAGPARSPPYLVTYIRVRDSTGRSCGGTLKCAFRYGPMPASPYRGLSS
jgi:hypothetical protein